MSDEPTTTYATAHLREEADGTWTATVEKDGKSLHRKTGLTSQAIAERYASDWAAEHIAEQTAVEFLRTV